MHALEHANRFADKINMISENAFKKKPKVELLIR